MGGTPGGDALAGNQGEGVADRQPGDGQHPGRVSGDRACPAERRPQAEQREAEGAQAANRETGDGNQSCGAVAACRSLMGFLIELYLGRCQVSAISHPAAKATCAMAPTAPQASMCLAVPVATMGKKAGWVAEAGHRRVLLSRNFAG